MSHDRGHAMTEKSRGACSDLFKKKVTVLMPIDTVTWLSLLL